MDKDKTKEHFIELCDSLLEKSNANSALEGELREAMHKLIASSILLAWNTCVFTQEKREAKKRLRSRGKERHTNADLLEFMLSVVDLKFERYREDDVFIDGVDVTYDDNGQPRASAFFEDEVRESDTSPDAFQRYMNSPEIRNRLASVPPDKFNEEMAKIVDEFNVRGKR